MLINSQINVYNFYSQFLLQTFDGKHFCKRDEFPCGYKPAPSLGLNCNFLFTCFFVIAYENCLQNVKSRNVNKASSDTWGNKKSLFAALFHSWTSERSPVYPFHRKFRSCSVDFPGDKHQNLSLSCHHLRMPLRRRDLPSYSSKASK